MVRKTLLRVLLLITILVISVCSYFFIADIQSNVPDDMEKQKTVETNEFMGRKLFTISPQDGEKSGKVILYFHGGAYVGEATNQHWNFLEKIMKDTKATIIMPDYPLTPKYTYKDVMTFAESVYKRIINYVKPENLVVMGDSAGGGLALGLEEKISQNNIELPSKTILISPWLDTNLTNEKINEVQKNDKDLSKEKLALAAFLYSRGLQKEDDYFVNPINGDLSKLKNITIFTGTYDILNPDCYVLKQKAKEQGTVIEVKEYATASHIWIINNEDELANKAYQDLLKEF